MIGHKANDGKCGSPVGSVDSIKSVSPPASEIGGISWDLCLVEKDTKPSVNMANRFSAVSDDEDTCEPCKDKEVWCGVECSGRCRCSGLDP